MWPHWPLMFCQNLFYEPQSNADRQFLSNYCLIVRKLYIFCCLKLAQMPNDYFWRTALAQHPANAKQTP